jgi:hypothetical protein
MAKKLYKVVHNLPYRNVKQKSPSGEVTTISVQNLSKISINSLETDRPIAYIPDGTLNGEAIAELICRLLNENVKYKIKDETQE